MDNGQEVKPMIPGVGLVNKNTHVYCTNCINGCILFKSILFDLDIPHCCQGCDFWNPEDSVRLEERPNYSPKI